MSRLDNLTPQELSCIEAVESASTQAEKESVFKRACAYISSETRIALLAVTLWLASPALAQNPGEHPWDITSAWQEIQTLESSWDTQRAQAIRENIYSVLARNFLEEYPDNERWQAVAQRQLDTINEFDDRTKELFWATYESITSDLDMELKSRPRWMVIMWIIWVFQWIQAEAWTWVSRLNTLSSRLWIPESTFENIVSEARDWKTNFNSYNWHEQIIWFLSQFAIASDNIRDMRIAQWRERIAQWEERIAQWEEILAIQEQLLSALQNRNQNGQ